MTYEIYIYPSAITGWQYLGLSQSISDPQTAANTLAAYLRPYFQTSLQIRYTASDGSTYIG